MTVSSGYRDISPTAKIVAHLRSYSDIPLAEDIAQEIGAHDFVRDLLDGEFPKVVLQWMAPYAEARYKSVVQAIRKAGGSQVLELASGFSFRGAAMTADPFLHYVETDLSEVHNERLALRKDLERAGKLPSRPNLVFAPADIMMEDDLERVVAGFDPAKPLTVVHEGLFLYFSMAERKAAATTIGKLLRRFGGVWLTPDLEAKGDQMRQRWGDTEREVDALMASLTHRDMRALEFESPEHIVSFFTELGFSVAAQPQIDGTYTLTSAERVSTTPEQLKALRKSRLLWTLRP